MLYFENFDHVVRNKYGCHMIKEVLEKLATYMSNSMNALDRFSRASLNYYALI